MKQNNNFGFKSQAMKLINAEVIDSDEVLEDEDGNEMCFISEMMKDQNKLLVEGTWSFDIGYCFQSVVVTLTNPTVGLVADLALGQKLVALREMGNEQAERQLEDIACFFEALSWDSLASQFIVHTGS